SAQFLSARRVLAVRFFADGSSKTFPTVPFPALDEGSRVIAESRAGFLSCFCRLHFRNSSKLAELQNLLRRRRGKQVHAPGYDSSPSGLVARAEPGPVIAVAVLVEEQQIAPGWVFLELRRSTMDRPLA